MLPCAKKNRYISEKNARVTATPWRTFDGTANAVDSAAAAAAIAASAAAPRLPIKLKADTVVSVGDTSTKRGGGVQLELKTTTRGALATGGTRVQGGNGGGWGEGWMGASCTKKQIGPNVLSPEASEFFTPIFRANFVYHRGAVHVYSMYLFVWYIVMLTYTCITHPIFEEDLQ